MLMVLWWEGEWQNNEDRGEGVGELGRLGRTIASLSQTTERLTAGESPSAHAIGPHSHPQDQAVSVSVSVAVAAKREGTGRGERGNSIVAVKK